METVVLRPERGVAARWTAASAVLIALATWLVTDSGGYWVMFVLLGISIAVSLYFLLPLVAPGWFEVHIDGDGVRARTAWQHVDVRWSDVAEVHVRSLGGEPYVDFDVLSHQGGDWVITTQPILLPLGVTVAEVRDHLARARVIAARQARVAAEATGP